MSRVQFPAQRLRRETGTQASAWVNDSSPVGDPARQERWNDFPGGGLRAKVTRSGMHKGKRTQHYRTHAEQRHGKRGYQANLKQEFPEGGAICTGINATGGGGDSTWTFENIAHLFDVSGNVSPADSVVTNWAADQLGYSKSLSD